MSTGGDIDKQMTTAGGDTCMTNVSSGDGSKALSGGDASLVNILLSRMDVLCKEFNAVRNDINNISAENKNLSKSVTNTSLDIKTSINYMKENFNKFNKELNKLTQDNKKLRNEIDQLRSQIASNNQLIYRNMIKISNIPKRENENLEDTFSKLCDILSFELNPSAIDVIYRKKSRYSRFEPLIIVSFLRNKDKSEFLKLKKSKGEIYTTDIDPSSNKSLIYISEFMSPWNMKLYSEVKQLKQRGLLQYLWFRNGRVLARVNATSAVVVVNCVDDIKKFQTGASSQANEPSQNDDDHESGQTATPPSARTMKKKRKTLSSPSTSSITEFFRLRSDSTSN